MLTSNELFSSKFSNMLAHQPVAISQPLYIKMEKNSFKGLHNNTAY